MSASTSSPRRRTTSSKCICLPKLGPHRGVKPLSAGYKPALTSGQRGGGHGGTRTRYLSHTKRAFRPLNFAPNEFWGAERDLNPHRSRLRGERICRSMLPAHNARPARRLPRKRDVSANGPAQLAEATGFEPVVYAVTGCRGQPDSPTPPRNLVAGVGVKPT